MVPLVLGRWTCTCRDENDSNTVHGWLILCGDEWIAAQNQPRVALSPSLSLSLSSSNASPPSAREPGSRLEQGLHLLAIQLASRPAEVARFRFVSTRVRRVWLSSSARRVCSSVVRVAPSRSGVRVLSQCWRAFVLPHLSCLRSCSSHVQAESARLLVAIVGSVHKGKTHGRTTPIKSNCHITRAAPTTPPMTCTDVLRNPPRSRLSVPTAPTRDRITTEEESK